MLGREVVVRGEREHRSGETNGIAAFAPAGRKARCLGSLPPGSGCPMEALLTSTFIVALAEIGDKTQLLAIVLATRFKRPWPIILGILVATLANHSLAALVGHEAAAWLDGKWFRYLVAASFVAMGL